MVKLLTVLLVFAVFQASVKSLPVPEKDDEDATFLIVNEKKDVQKTSSSNMIVPEAEYPETFSPEHMMSDAAIASLLQLLEKALLISLAPRDAFGGMNQMSFDSGNPFNIGAPFSSGEVHETIIGPGTKLRVIQKTFTPPGITVVATGTVDGKNMNKITQNQVHASQNLKVLQSGSTGNREDDLLPDIVDVEDSDDVPKDILNDLKVLETIRDQMEKFNSVFK